MTTLIRLNTAFSNPDLPVAINYKEQISKISSLFGWYNVDAGSYDYDTEGYVYLDDLSGNNVRFIKDSSRAGAPTVVESAINGRNALDIQSAGGVSGGLTREVQDVPANNFTFFCVFQHDGDLTDTPHYIACQNAATLGPALLVNASGETVAGAPTGPSVSAGTNGTTPRGFMVSYSDGTLYVSSSEDWSSFNTSTGNTDAVSAAFFIGQAAESSTGCKGQFAELIMLEEGVTGAGSGNYDMVTRYLSAKYGL